MSLDIFFFKLGNNYDKFGLSNDCQFWRWRFLNDAQKKNEIAQKISKVFNTFSICERYNSNTLHILTSMDSLIVTSWEPSTILLQLI